MIRIGFWGFLIVVIVQNYYPKPKYLIIRSFGPLGKRQSLDLSGLTPADVL